MSIIGIEVEAAYKAAIERLRVQIARENMEGPPCNVCGDIMVASGATHYRCPTCQNIQEYKPCPDV